jgi:hypothetical protein
MRELYNISELRILDAQKFTFIYPLRVEVTVVQKQDCTLQATFALLVGEYVIGEFTSVYDTIEKLLDAFDIADHEELFALVSDH